MPLRIILLLIVLVALSIIVLGNNEEVNISLLFWKFQKVPVIVVILISILLGVLITLPNFMKINSNNAKLLKEKQKRITELERIVIEGGLKAPDSTKKI